MIVHNIPTNTSVQEVINQVMADPNATDREKFFVAAIEKFGLDRGNNQVTLGDR